MINTYLEHHGIKGMRWGIRRYQNKDGSLTPAGRRRLSQLDAEREALVGTKSESKPKTFREMSTDELRDQINRRRMEKEYLELNKQVSDLVPEEVSTGKKIVSHLSSKVIVPAITDAGKKFLTDFLNKQGSKLLGLDKSEDISKPLKDVVADMNLKKQKIELDKYFDEYNKQQASKQKSTKDSSDKKTTSDDQKKKAADHSKKDSSTESKKSPQNESPKSESSKKSETSEKTETYTGKVYGEGTSHETFARNRNEEKRRDSETIYTNDFTDKTTSDPEVRAVISIGQQYVAGLLEEKKK